MFKYGDRVKGIYIRVDLSPQVEEEYVGTLITDFEDGSYCVKVDGKDADLLIETYYNDTIERFI